MSAVCAGCIRRQPAILFSWQLRFARPRRMPFRRILAILRTTSEDHRIVAGRSVNPARMAATPIPETIPTVRAARNKDEKAASSMRRPIRRVTGSSYPVFLKNARLCRYNPEKRSASALTRATTNLLIFICGTAPGPVSSVELEEGCEPTHVWAIILPLKACAAPLPRSGGSRPWSAEGRRAAWSAECSRAGSPD